MNVLILTFVDDDDYEFSVRVDGERLPATDPIIAYGLRLAEGFVDSGDFRPTGKLRYRDARTLENFLSYEAGREHLAVNPR